MTNSHTEKLKQVMSGLKFIYPINDTHTYVALMCFGYILIDFASFESSDQTKTYKYITEQI